MAYIGINIGKYETKNIAILDATTTAIAIMAQYFMAKKIIENWHLWIVLNLLSIPLYIHTGNYTFVAIWFVYLINSIYGLYMWHYNLKLQQKGML